MASGRHYFHYRMDKPILNFYTFQSARYEVRHDRWQDVTIDVYYQPGHEFNVDRMIRGAKAALEYGSKHFSPYQYRELRIAEFPRYAAYAQAAPGTIAVLGKRRLHRQGRSGFAQGHRLPVLRHRARSRPPVVGAPADRRRQPRRDRAVRKPGRIHGADDDAASFGASQDAALPALRPRANT